MSHSSQQHSPSNHTNYPIHLPHSPLDNPQHGYCTPSSIQIDCVSPFDLDSSSHVDGPSLLVSPDNDTCYREDNIPLSSPSCTPHPLLCTICVDLASSPADVVTIASCGHSFCLSCLASWFQVRHFCPNCKSMFSDVVVSRDVGTGNILCGPVTEDGRPARSVISLSDLMICPPAWLKIQLTPVHSAKHDIEHSFGMPRTETQMSYQDLLALQRHFQNQVSISSVAAPAYEREEIEDDLEDQYWDEEERAHQRLMRTNRTISNRRYGNSGYLAAGRMHARPMNSNANSSSSASSSCAGCSTAHAKMKKKKKKKEMESVQNSSGTTAMAAEASNSSRSGQQCGIAQSCTANANSQSGQATTGSGVDPHQKTGGRKKKVKKNSRAGIAATKAAAWKAQEASSMLTEASSTDRSSPVYPSAASSNAGNA